MTTYAMNVNYTYTEFIWWTDPNLTSVDDHYSYAVVQNPTPKVKRAEIKRISGQGVPP